MASFSRRLAAISLKLWVRAPISSREGTCSVMEKLPSAIARVPSISCEIGRDRNEASVTAPPMPSSTMATLIRMALLRARASAAAIERWLKPR